MLDEKRYTCPIKEHYAIFTDANTKCPRCGMALVEIETDNHETDNHESDGGHDDTVLDRSYG